MKKFLIALSAIVMLASCSNKGLEGSWKVTSIGTADLSDLFNEATLEFNESKGEYYGVTGVNTVNGNFKANSSQITFTDGPMTKMAADPHSMEVENAYIQALGAASTYEIEDGTLTLKDCCGNVLMTLSK